MNEAEKQAKAEAGAKAFWSYVAFIMLMLLLTLVVSVMVSGIVNIIVGIVKTVTSG